jgi:recombination protein RecR
MNLTEDEMCSICTDASRDKTTITVVEDVIDMMSFETGDIYHGLYHVLHGRIDPLNSIGPEDIYVDQLLARLREDQAIQEVLLATNLNM